MALALLIFVIVLPLPSFESGSPQPGIVAQLVFALGLGIIELLVALIIAIDIERYEWPSMARVASVVALLFMTTPLVISMGVYGWMLIGGEWI